MIFLPTLLGGIAVACAAGCADGVARPFHLVHPDAGPDVGAMDADADVDAAADTGPSPDAPPDTPPIVCPTKLVGYATMGTGTTGGGDAGVVTVTTLDQLRMAVGQMAPAVVRISGMIPVDTPTTPIEVESDKTILPNRIGDGVTGSGFLIKDKHNVIVRNLTITKPVAPSDGVTIQHSTNVWVDHCDLSSDLVMPKAFYDGLVDITHASDNVTVSWNRFHDHFNTSLIGHSDAAGNTEDPGHLTVTLHHNLFLNTPTGSPRARFGRVHIFSNHYQKIDTYGIASTMGATTLIENNVFDDVKIPMATHWEDMADGMISDPVSNRFNPMDSLSAIVVTMPFTTWKPPYVYADSADLIGVAILVDTCAGVGKVP